MRENINDLGALVAKTPRADDAAAAAFNPTERTKGIEAGAAKILIDPFLSDDPSWGKGWIGSRAGDDSTQGGGR